MVSHIQRPRVGGSQDPKSPRRLRQRSKPATRISVCQRCGLRREMSPGFKTMCIECVVSPTIQTQPQKAALEESGSDDPQWDTSMATEDCDHEHMQTGLGSGSKDYDKVRRSNAKARTATTPAAVAKGASVNTGDRDTLVPTQQNAPFQIQPWAGVPSTSFLSGITPWTPVDSSIFTGPPANTNPLAAMGHETHMAPAANNRNPSAKVNHSAAMNVLGSMNTPEVMNIAAPSMNPTTYYAGSPRPMAPPASMAPTIISSQTVKGPASISSSPTLTPHASTSPPASIDPAYMDPRTSPNPHTTIHSSESMNSSAFTNPQVTRAPQATMAPQAIMNSQAMRAPSKFNSPPVLMAPPGANPPVSIIPQPDSTAFATAMGLSSNNIMVTVAKKTPARGARVRNRTPAPRARNKAPAAPPPQRRMPPKPLNPTIRIPPALPKSPPVTKAPPATMSSSTAMNPPSIIISPPLTTPAEVTEKSVCTNSPTVGNPTMTTSTAKATLPMSIFEASKNHTANRSSLAARGPTGASATAAMDLRPSSIPPAAMKTPATLTTPALMRPPVFNNPSDDLESEYPLIEANLKPHGPAPANAVNYLYLVHTQFSYSARASDGIPMKLDAKTKKGLINMEELVSLPFSSTSFFLLPPRSLSLYLLTLYRHEVYFTYPFFSMNKFMDALINLFKLITKYDFSSPHDGLGCSDESSPSTPLFQCALFMMLTHALHFANIDRDDKAFVASVFWKCAKTFMAMDILKTSCLAAVQTLLIIAVAFNSSSLPGNESKIPAELASRIARSLGIDNEQGHSADASAGIHEVNRQTWYGCVMMSLFSQTIDSKLPLKSGMARAPSNATRYQSPVGSVDFSFFINCVILTEKLERILENIRRVREPVLQTFPVDGYNSFDTVVPELRGKLSEFIKSLPAELRWGVSGLPSDYIYIVGFDQPRAASNARFMHLRAMLFRPILMQIGIDGWLESNMAACKIDPVVKDKTLTCAMSCVNTAISLIDFLYKRYLIELKSNKEWWWDPYHTSTAGLILVMAQTSATLWSFIQVGTVVAAWKACQEMLGYGATDNHFHRDALNFLWDTNRSIAGFRVLENNYAAIPQIRRPNSAASWNFHRTPHSQFANPCSPFLDPSAMPIPMPSNINSKAPLKLLKPKQSLSDFPYASSAGATPFAAPGPSTASNAMPSGSNATTASGTGAVANVSALNSHAVPHASSQRSNIPPPFTAPLTSGAVPNLTDSGSTIHSVSTSPGSNISSLPSGLSILPQTAPESDAVSYASASNLSTVPYTTYSTSTTAPYADASCSSTIPYAASPESTISPHSTSLNLSTVPYTASPEFTTVPHTITPTPNTILPEASSWISPVPYAGPYTVFSDPNATLYTEESLGSNATLWPETLAFNLPPSSSNMVPSVPTSNPNSVNFGNFGDLGDIGDLDSETVAFFQAAFGKPPPLDGNVDPGDDPFFTSNWQS